VVGSGDVRLPLCRLRLDRTVRLPRFCGNMTRTDGVIGRVRWVLRVGWHPADERRSYTADTVGNAKWQGRGMRILVTWSMEARQTTRFLCDVFPYRRWRDRHSFATGGRPGYLSNVPRPDGVLIQLIDCLFGRRFVFRGARTKAGITPPSRCVSLRSACISMQRMIGFVAPHTMRGIRGSAPFGPAIELASLWGARSL